MKKMHGLETYGNKSLITSSLRNDSTIQDIPDSQRDRIRRLLNEAVKSRFGSTGRGLSSSVQEELNTLEKKKRIAQSVFDEMSKSQYEEQRIQNVPGMFYGVSTALPRFKDLIYRLKGALLPNDPEYANITKAWKFIKDLLDRSEQEVILQVS
ncbi:unnamed protein product [Trichobilharzia regenti]|nr:unnamed protein product [Trichobilharzia regenti]